MIRLGQIVAWVAVVVGLLRIAMGFFVATAFTGEDYIAASRRYLGSSTSGEAIDEGIVLFVIGIAFGLLVRVAKNKTSPSKS